jgi:DNA-binding FadR family transcriptional regulator
MDIDFEFHEAIVQASGNHTLIDLVQMLSDWIKLFMQMMAPRAETWTLTTIPRSHRLILEAMRQGNEDEAADAMRQHLVGAKTSLIDALVHDAQEQGNAPETLAYPNIWQ